ncbi:hypothetical protein B0A50_06439 [Salinomyces thailandicus]|uniref:Uncharacterized protein n=1 Tax=Salinomyces thailandicus TaxID=706561 RepID=A0A4U0TPE4_9PEZI|nr:hypothetical protein B0A50_06439 [Salinomyces thailandica]
MDQDPPAPRYALRKRRKSNEPSQGTDIDTGKVATKVEYLPRLETASVQDVAAFLRSDWREWRALDDTPTYNRLCARLHALAVELHAHSAVYIHPKCVAFESQKAKTPRAGLLETATYGAFTDGVRFTRADRTKILTRIASCAHITSDYRESWVDKDGEASVVQWHNWGVAIIQNPEGKHLVFYDDNDRRRLEGGQADGRPHDVLARQQEKFFHHLQKRGGKIAGVWLATLRDDMRADVTLPLPEGYQSTLRRNRCMPNTFHWILRVLQSPDSVFRDDDPKWGGLERLKGFEGYI